MPWIIDRRRALAAGVAAATSFLWESSIAPASAANGAAELIARFTGGVAPARGKVKLDLPDIAENGSTVPLAVAVESPMTPEAYVKDVLVVADGNPRPGIAAFHFTPASGAAEVATRIRLAQTQTVTAIARMSDGSLYMASKQVTVTIGGCLGG
jgi:sulfur-oxidizing protein SoxY